VSKIDEDTGIITLGVTATDYDSPLLYYDYSYDGGLTYSPLQIWPGCEALSGSYTDTFQLDIQVPSGTQPDLILRAYNMFDVVASSNRITMLRTILYEDKTTENPVHSEQVESSVEEEKFLPGTETFMPTVSEIVKEEEGVRFFDFLLLCFILVVGLFVLLFITRMILSIRRRRRRHQRRKFEGDNRNHPR
uniref:hypothetical protein n=1 Tax=Acetatifactor sp. TaxID=1872090 RepID=UPI00405620C2